MTSKWAEPLVTAMIIAVVCLAAIHTADSVIAGDAGVTHVSRTAEEAKSSARNAIILYALGMLVLTAGRYRSLRRGRSNLPAFLVTPAVVCASGLGLISQMNHGQPLLAGSWRGPGFAIGAGLAGALASLVLFAPHDPVYLLRNYRGQVTIFVVASGILLWLFGSGPTGSSSQINLNLGLFSVQPIEAIKLAFVCLLGFILGEKAVQLRFQRERAWLLRYPRPKLIAVACGVLAALFAVLIFLVKDLGPTLVLTMVFLVLFYVVTRSLAWVGAAVGLLAAGFLIVSRNPAITGSQTLATRFDMWVDPWMNGLPNGSQLAASHWAIAAGGLWGRGLSHAHPGALPAGHTDLMIAHLAETTGVWGGILYLICVGACVVSGLRIAARNREPERVMVAAACSLLLLCQWVVIFSGTTGLLPLTGLAVPFLSWGKSSMIAFLLAVGILLRLAEDGSTRAATVELVELRSTVRQVTHAAVVMLVLGGICLTWLGVVRAPATSVRAVLETLADGMVRMRNDPRLVELLTRVRRGEILDRNGAVLAGTGPRGERFYPLNDAVGALLCPAESGRVLRREWCLERIHDRKLRGYPEREQRPAVWRARGSDRALLTVKDGEETEADRRLADQLAGGAPVRLVPVSTPDLSDISREDLEATADDVDARSVRLTLDARLQLAAVEILRRHVGDVDAAAAAVIDVDTGEVLARAQVPDIDLGRDDWYSKVIEGDPEFTGIYGPWVDKTGVMGFQQAGSVAKLFTALAATRRGLETTGEGCGVRSVRTFHCLERDRIGNRFDYPGWPLALHDHPKDRPHGEIDVAGGLAQSCNVAFSELTLQTGPEALRALSRDGLEFGWKPELDPGDPESRRLASTGIGQGAAVLNVSQAARLVAAVGAGGVYRRCPSSLLLGAPCETTRLVDDPLKVEVILAGMHLAMKSGTGAPLEGVPGVRLYGKTGTADSIAIRDEAPYGYDTDEERPPPHSWFLALAEPETDAPCDSGNNGRLAVATLIPRGGGGTRAGAAAVEIVAAARSLGYLDGGS